MVRTCAGGLLICNERGHLGNPTWHPPSVLLPNQAGTDARPEVLQSFRQYSGEHIPYKLLNPETRVPLAKRLIANVGR